MLRGVFFGDIFFVNFSVISRLPSSKLIMLAGHVHVQLLEIQCRYGRISMANC